MTTIACNLEFMAADSKMTDGDIAYPVMKMYVFGQAIVGVAGDSANGGRFLRWFKKWADGESADAPEIVAADDDEPMRALVLTPGGIYTFDEGCWPEEVLAPYHAVGTGAAIALAAMARGLNPEEAVLEACGVDNNTCEPIHRLNLNAPATKVFSIAGAKKRGRK